MLKLLGKCFLTVAVLSAFAGAKPPPHILYVMGDDGQFRLSRVPPLWASNF